MECIKMTDALNKVIPVDFASENIVAYAVSNVQDFPIFQRSIIVNMGLEPLFFNEQPQRGLAPGNQPLSRIEVLSQPP